MTNHFPVVVRQPLVATVVAEGQPLVVEAQEMQDRRVQVVNVGLLFRGA